MEREWRETERSWQQEGGGREGTVAYGAQCREGEQ